MNKHINSKEKEMEKIKKFFKIEERGSSIRTEIIAGLVTFLAMAYILPVNTFMLANTGMPIAGVFLATAIAAAIATLIMGLVANYPVALAPGMGVNAFFTYSVVIIGGYSWQEALAAVFVSGILFLLISVSGLRRKIINAVPMGLKYAVGAGIGFFIAFIGLKNAGVIQGDGATLVTLGNWSQPQVLLAIFGIILVVFLYAKGNKFALIISIAATAVVGLILNALNVPNMPFFDSEGMSLVGAGETIGAAFTGFGILGSVKGWFIILSFLFIDFFDTAGTLMAVGNQAKLLDENGELVGGDKALLADAVGTIAGAVLGTSTVTSYVESSTGIESGARTGLSSVVVGVLFLLSVLLYPLLSVVNGVMVDGVAYSPVTSMALVLVGAIMVTQLKNIDWTDKAIVVPGFISIIMMMLAFSIAEGIAIGFLFYPIVMIAQKRAKEVHPIMYGLAAFFVLHYIIVFTLM